MSSGWRHGPAAFPVGRLACKASGFPFNSGPGLKR